MLSYHAILADRVMLDTAQLATDTICATCGEDNPELAIVVHGIPVVVCNAACEEDLVKYWAPATQKTPSRFVQFVRKFTA